jgi:hypothetical protein
MITQPTQRQMDSVTIIKDQVSGFLNGSGEIHAENLILNTPSGNASNNTITKINESNELVFSNSTQEKVVKQNKPNIVLRGGGGIQKTRE